MKRHLIPVLYIAVMAAAIGCAPKSMTPISDEDNPAHHYLVGMGLLEKKDLAQAESHFDRALMLDPKYATAMAGKALTAAMKGMGYGDKAHQAVELNRALEYLDDALDASDGDSQEFSISVTAIRVFTHGQPKKWFSKTQDYYNDAKRLKKVNPTEMIYYRSKTALDYFMGVAAYKDLQFRAAEDLLSKVTQAPPSRWHQPAGMLFKKVHKIVRATANYTLTDVTKKIAVKDHVVRADVAALLVDDLHLDRLMAGRIAAPSKDARAAFVPADIVNNPFRSEILTVLKWKLRGLEPKFDNTTQAYLFNPEGHIKRKELAFMLEDLLMKISGDEGITTAHFGQNRSPYPDVPPSSPWFNAVMNAVSRNLMESDLSGAFRPEDTADGAELLLAVLRLRDAMNIY
jgi:tetratricopeptide (TPR) repeat protein